MAKQDPYAALRYREFNIFILVRFALVFAWSMQFVIIEWQVYALTKDPLYIGLIGLMEIIPALGMALFAGHIVDQKEKRNLLAICIALFSIISFGMFWITSPTITETWSVQQILYAIYTLVFFGGLLRSFFGPSIFSLVALIVPKKIYPNAATWNSSTWQMARVLGVTFAGFSIGWLGENDQMGVHWSLCIVFGLVMFSLVMLFSIKKKPILNPNIGEPMVQSLKEGVTFVFKTKAILGALTLDMISVLFGGAIALAAVFATDILGVGSEGFGILVAAPNVGSFLTMLVTAYIPIVRKAGLKLLVAVFGFGLSIIAFGLSSIFWISVLALFFSGVFDGVSMVIRQTILQLKTPDHMRGRVSSVNSMFVGSSNELGAFESGLTAKLMGTATAVVFGGTMTLITVLTTAFVSPTFRKLDLTEDMETHENED
ncbi:MFS transporter [Ichthyenterobacterium magnum]|uniref:Putative MFS family arabinose efflux permease n=1 Tax=Ichthyenterobacterium magnum TaxID=1230530 RepID=A0A420DX03_9FLAO|nr:MFS transporter [Ichthyenterobacterium magnum]RKE98739.1 putative MFS family arabinose efflux permease [Ichthyenterobacterium magnum]